MKKGLLAIAALVMGLVVLDARAQTYEPYRAALLGGMDKVTGEVSSFEVMVGETASFGTLEVKPRACRKTPPEEAPESASFLEIDDEVSHERVFSGWMFASSPGVSALEHPVYDVWVIDCVEGSEDPASSE